MVHVFGGYDDTASFVIDALAHVALPDLGSYIPPAIYFSVAIDCRVAVASNADHSGLCVRSIERLFDLHDLSMAKGV